MSTNPTILQKLVLLMISSRCRCVPIKPKMLTLRQSNIYNNLMGAMGFLLEIKEVYRHSINSICSGNAAVTRLSS